MSRARRLLGTAAVAGLVVSATGLVARAAQSAADARDSRRHPPPGRLFDVGGHRLHAAVEGEAQGAPAVVFEAGLGGDHRTWREVRDRLAPALGVAYDRAGTGWSEAGPRPRTAAVMADELHRLLRAAGIAPPYVLVAHSFGATAARVFASLHPTEVGGLVLVDPSHEDQRQFVESTLRRALSGRAKPASVRPSPGSAGSACGPSERPATSPKPTGGWPHGRRHGAGSARRRRSRRVRSRSVARRPCRTFP